MKSLFSKDSRFFLINEAGLSSKRVLSAKSVRIMLWTRIILKIYLILLGLYLIAKFADFIKFFIMN